MRKKIYTRLIGIALIAILVTLIGVTSIYYYLFKNQVAINASSGTSIFINAIPIVLVIIVLIVILCVLLADYLTKKLVNPIAAMANIMDDTEGNLQNNEVYKELEPFVQTIRAQHENILAAAKMRQDFTANVSHELKTPLTAISGYAELIANGMVTEEQTAIFIGEIRKNSDRLLTLINDIIRLSELDHADMLTGLERMDLYELAIECFDDLQVNASRRGIDFTLEGETCIIRGNQDMLRELIENLCENAIRYNNDGGYVRLFVGELGGKSILSVEDNGIGIPTEHQDRVFERFYRVDKSRSKATGGTGLGLAIVKHIVAIHEANITLNSEVGKGTTITVIF